MLIIADALALPRDDVAYEHAWPGMLDERLPIVMWINRAQGLSTSERLNREGNQGADCLVFYHSGLVVPQLGICDCPPRALLERTTAYVYRCPFGLEGRFSAWRSRWRSRKTGNCLVPLADYERNMRDDQMQEARGTMVIALAAVFSRSLLVSKRSRTDRLTVACNEPLLSEALERRVAA